MKDILFIDDNQSQILLYKRRFPDNTYTTSLAEAEFILSRHEFDWIVSDLHMNNGDPQEVIKSLDSCKTIFVSFHADLNDANLGIKKGHKLTKGINHLNNIEEIINGV